MKKVKLLILGVGVAGLLVMSGCDWIKYEAYVTIVNIGSLEMIGSVNDSEEHIAKYSSQTWAIPLDHENEEALVELYAEPLVGGDHDEATATLHGDRDIETWLTGWDPADPQGTLKKKASYFAKKK